MGQMIRAAFWLVLPLLVGQDDSLTRARESIREADLRRHAEKLASDELEGRNSGYAGNLKAAEYLVEQFTSFGLKAELQKFKFAVRNDTGKPLIRPETAETANVVARLEGSDEKLKEEVVLIGAHYDHVGKAGQTDPGRSSKRGSKDDTIWNGADDNASGTAALLEVAQAFAESGLKPKRTILFVAFSAEEQGLLGSLWYVGHPVAPLEKTVLMINLDMVGRQIDKPVEVHGVGTAVGLRDVVDRVVKENELTAELFDYGDVREADSDHAPFFEVRVPTMFFFTGFHEDYHESSDHADKLNYASMVKIARCVLGVAADAADRPERHVFAPPRALGIVQGGILQEAEAKRLGLKPGEGGVLVAEVKAGAAAGFKKDDWIVEVGGVKLPLKETIKQMRRAVERAKPGEPLEIVVLRGKERVTLKVEWK